MKIKVTISEFSFEGELPNQVIENFVSALLPAPVVEEEAPTTGGIIKKGG